MPNYRYNTPEYMRRNTCGGQQTVQSAQPVQGCQAVTREKCCEDRAGYDVLSGMPLAMAYVPWQNWCAIYETEKGFHCGTIFEELNKPFKGMGGRC